MELWYITRSISNNCFSEIVNLNAGNIHLYDTSNNLIETVDLTGARVSGSGTNHFNWLDKWLDPSEYYYVQIDSNAVFNQGGADLAGWVIIHQLLFLLELDLYCLLHYQLIIKLMLIYQLAQYN